MYNLLSSKLVQLEFKLKVNADDLVRIWKVYYEPMPTERAKKKNYENRQSLHP